MNQDEYELAAGVDAIEPTLEPYRMGEGDLAARLAAHPERIVWVDGMTHREYWPDGRGGWIDCEPGGSPYSPVNPIIPGGDY